MVLAAVMPVDEHRPDIRIEIEPEQEVPILVADGVLDSSTYRSIRDTVIKAALDEPRAVIVDVNRLSAPSASAWTVFTSARWHVSVWPDVPILLVCAQPQVRRAITAGGVPRYVPVHATRELALDAVHGQSLHLRRRARTELPRSRAASALRALSLPIGSPNGIAVSSFRSQQRWRPSSSKTSSTTPIAHRC